MPPERYYERFSVVEVQETFYEPPAEKTLRRWRRRAPQGFVFTLRAWQLITHPPDSPTYRRLTASIAAHEVAWYGSFQLTDQVLRAWETLARAARALEATVILFQTPASFGPSLVNRARVERFFGQIDRQGFACAWEPLGVWEDEEVASLCKALGLLPAVDPLMSTVGSEGGFYFRLRGTPRKAGRYSEKDLIRIHERSLGASAASGQGYVLFDTPQAARDAERLMQWLRAHRRNGEPPAT